MNKPHKHAALIKAWADGAVIQVKTLGHVPQWRDCLRCVWSEDYEYRIKPEPKEIIQTYRVGRSGEVLWVSAFGRQAMSAKVKWTIDPETNKILKVELVE